MDVSQNIFTFSHFSVFILISLLCFFYNQEMERRELIKKEEENEKNLKSNIKFSFFPICFFLISLTFIFQFSLIISIHSQNKNKKINRKLLMNQQSYPISLNQFSNEHHLNYHVINKFWKFFLS